MIRKRTILIAACLGLALAACAGVPLKDAPPGPVLIEAVRLDPLPEPAAPETLPATAEKRGGKTPTAQQALTAANKAARQRPVSAEFAGATLFYAYEPGAIYELHTAPSFISTILLEPGEALIDIAAGDTARWTVSETATGSGGGAATLVMIKPHVAGLRTNLVLVTDRRAYLIEAVSAAGEAYTAQVAWHYPPPPPSSDPAPPVFMPINDAYRVRTTKGEPPAWVPVRVEDDGRRTRITFPDSIEASDMPPLFLHTGEGTELVNYRVQGRAYLVDRLIDVAELRFGRADPVIVRIERLRPEADRR